MSLNKKTEKELERAKVLLKAMCEICDKMDRSHFVLNFFEQTATYDGTDCDGDCLFTDVKEFLEESVESKEPVPEEKEEEKTIPFATVKNLKDMAKDLQVSFSEVDNKLFITNGDIEATTIPIDLVYGEVENEDWGDVILTKKDGSQIRADWNMEKTIDGFNFFLYALKKVEINYQTDTSYAIKFILSNKSGFVYGTELENK